MAIASAPLPSSARGCGAIFLKTASHHENDNRQLGHLDSVERILDIGCGDGVLLETVLSVHPHAHGVGVDGSADMLAAARERFTKLPTNAPTFVEADFESPAWVEALPRKQFDIIVSGFAIHHSPDDRKRAIYREIFDLLRPGGLFVNTEHVASVSSIGEALFERTYAELQHAFRAERGDKATLDAVLHEVHTCPAKAANKLVLVETQLNWLREIGFVDVDCFWKWYELAVFAGFRSDS